MQQKILSVILLAIGVLLLNCYIQVAELEKNRQPIQVAVQPVKPAIPTPKYSMSFETVEMENGINRKESGSIIANDSTVIVTTMPTFKGKWVMEDVFVSRGGFTFFFDEEMVTMIHRMGEKSYKDVFVRSK